MNNLLLFAGASRPPAVPRAPLMLPQPEIYDRVLPYTPTAGPDLFFYRGQFCGVRVPGAPWAPGCNAQNTDLVMTCLLDRYPVGVQDTFLKAYAQDGYTHIQRSIGHALANPAEGWAGVSVGQYNALSQRCKNEFGLFDDQWLLGGPVLRDMNQDAAFWAPVLEPLIASFLASGTIDTCCVGWQLDQFNVPGNPLIGIIAWIADRLPQTVPLYTHWVNEALAWWLTGGQEWTDRFGTINVHDRWTWWQAMQPYLTGGFHQGSPAVARANPKLYQDKMKDTLDQFRNGSMGLSRRGRVANFSLVGYEMTAQDQFDNGTRGSAPCSEQEGDTVGYIVACTTSGVDGHGLGGYGNGARRPDGTAL